MSPNPEEGRDSLRSCEQLIRMGEMGRETEKGYEEYGVQKESRHPDLLKGKLLQ